MTKPIQTGVQDREAEIGDRDRPLFMISAVARMVAVHPQTLRLYERLGLVDPQRSRGKKRLYSLRDVEHLQFIQNLTRDRGVNLSGVKMILDLQKEMDQIRRELHDALEVLRERFHERGASGEGTRIRAGKRDVKIRIERG
jgi:MerR family transcriptional regulator, heat shock protein HspR